MDPSRPDPFQLYLESLGPSPSAQERQQYSTPSALQRAFLELQRLSSGGGFQSQQSSTHVPSNLAGNDRSASLQELQQLATLMNEIGGHQQQQSVRTHLPGGTSTTAMSSLPTIYPNQNPSMLGDTGIDSSFLNRVTQEALAHHLLGQLQRGVEQQREIASLRHHLLIGQVLEDGRRLQDRQQELLQQQLLQHITSQRQLGQESEQNQSLQRLMLISQLYPSTAIPHPQPQAHAPTPVNSPSIEPFSQNRFVPATSPERGLPTFLSSRTALLQAPPSSGRFDVARRSVKQPCEQRVFSLARPNDRRYLSSYQIRIRQQLELFSSDLRDCLTSQQGRRRRVAMGQIGIRCKHCAHLPLQERGRASCYYPQKLISVYQAAQNIAKTHLAESCPCIPASVREELNTLHQRKETAAGGKAYWSDACIQMGLVDDEEKGIMLGPDATE